MQRLKVGVGLFVFLGLVSAEASAQDVPEEARKAIAHNLQGPFVVFRDTVQDELKLTDEQKEKLEEHLRELLPDAMQFFQSLDGLNGEEREKKLQAFRQKAQQKLAVGAEGNAQGRPEQATAPTGVAAGGGVGPVARRAGDWRKT